jgi:hypothetical protein
VFETVESTEDRSGVRRKGRSVSIEAPESSRGGLGGGWSSGSGWDVVIDLVLAFGLL